MGAQALHLMRILAPSGSQKSGRYALEAGAVAKLRPLHVPIWPNLVQPRASCLQLGLNLGPSWLRVRPTWPNLGPSWPTFAHLDTTWGHLGVNWGQTLDQLASIWANLGST